MCLLDLRKVLNFTIRGRLKSLNLGKVSIVYFLKSLSLNLTAQRKIDLFLKGTKKLKLNQVSLIYNILSWFMVTRRYFRNLSHCPDQVKKNTDSDRNRPKTFFKESLSLSNFTTVNKADVLIMRIKRSR